VLTLGATVAVLLGTTLVVLIIAVTEQRDAGRIAFRSQQALTLMSRLETSLVAIESGLRDYVERYPEGELEPINSRLDAYPEQVRELAAQVSDDPGQRARVRDIATQIEGYVLRATPLIGVAKRDPQDAKLQLLYPQNRQRVEELGRDLRDLAVRERTLVGQREENAEAQSRVAIALGVGGLGLVFVIVVGGTWYLRKSLVRPVVKVAAAPRQLAAGDLSTRVPAHRADEIGDLARGFNTMADSLERGQAELERSNAELTRSNSELEQFASVTSHDLQAPLTTISMYAELLERRQGTDAGAGHDLINGIRGATTQARTLIRDLLEYSRAGRGDLQVEPLPVSHVVDQTLEALAGSVEAAGARIRVGSLPVVLADRSNLSRVFQNLIGNAVKFTRGKNPEVTIVSERDGDMWRIEVRDNGIGMDPENARRIFEPFRRLHGEEDYPGTGIGLAVCERIVEQHGGRIWVQSAPGEGSVFAFTMPAAELAPGESAESLEPPVAASR
jgi:signal transduction histidine kinase